MKSTIIEQVVEHYQKGMRAPQIAQLLAKPVSSIYSVISKARTAGLIPKSSYSKRGPKKMITIPIAPPASTGKVIALFGSVEDVIEITRGWVQNG